MLTPVPCPRPRPAPPTPATTQLDVCPFSFSPALGDALRVRDPHHDHPGPLGRAPGHPSADSPPAAGSHPERREDAPRGDGQLGHPMLQQRHLRINIKP